MPEDSKAPAPETPEAAPAAAAPEKQAEQSAPRSGGGDRARGNGGGRGRGGEQRGGRGGDRRGGGRGRRPGAGGGQREEKEFLEELLGIDRVTRVVKGGRRLRFRASVVIGDRKGRVGFGVEKAAEVPAAIQKATARARKNLIHVPLAGGTIPHEVRIKHKAARMLLRPAREGTGIIAGGAMRKIADLCGLSDVVGKSFGTGNRVSSAQAMIMALSSLRKKPSPKSAEKTADAPAKKANATATPAPSDA